ncbi:MAG: glucose-inhibited division protein A [Cyanobacteria bacterium]|nr:glucose-inhibited division protein A [Cyanobacteriota bacterium]MDW8200018.1 hypothetical protein [Cyanobacteriota bacterium SKYGB_h_bin112]
MNRPKLTAIVTGAIAIILSIVYLVLVQLLDLRGEMKPAPIDDLATIVHINPIGHSA